MFIFHLDHFVSFCVHVIVQIFCPGSSLGEVKDNNYLYKLFKIINFILTKRIIYLTLHQSFIFISLLKLFIYF